MSRQLSLFGSELPERPHPRPSSVAKRPGSAFPRHAFFFALFPPPDQAMAIVARRQMLWEQGLRGNPIPTDRIHMTLVPIGEYDDPPWDLVRLAADAAATVIASPFDVHLDRVMTFRSRREVSPVVLLPSGEIEGLAALERQLRNVLADARLVHTQGSGQKFTPHVTLAYSAGKLLEQPVEPVHWTVGDFVLIHSFRGRTLYSALGRWPLVV